MRSIQAAREISLYRCGWFDKTECHVVDQLKKRAYEWRQLADAVRDCADRVPKMEKREEGKCAGIEAEITRRAAKVDPYVL
jgi:hypothetical protein